MSFDDTDSAPHEGGRVFRAGAEISSATSALILIHGRGAPAETMIPLAEAFASESTHVMIPEATGNVWYPQRFIEPLESNEPYLSSALHVVDSLVRSTIDAGVPSERIVLGGFSQGACLASEYAARNPRRYGGILVFSGGVIGPLDMEFSYDGDLAGTPVFVGCSDSDFHIPEERVRTTAEVLTSLGAEVTLRLYPNMDHTINEEEIELSRELVQSALGPR